MGLDNNFKSRLLRAILTGDSKELLDDIVRDVKIGEHQVRRKCLTCCELFWGDKVDIVCPPCSTPKKERSDDPVS